MAKIIKKVTALFVCCLLSTPLLAQENPMVRLLLDKMSKANQTLNYEYSFVQMTPNNVDSLRYRHATINNSTYAQLLTLDGGQQEIIQRNNLVAYFGPNYQPFTIEAKYIVDHLPAVLNANFPALSQYYDFVEMGKNRIANRIVQTVSILPKDNFRYQYVLYIDEENNLLLRSDMLDRDGNLLEQFRVVTLYVANELNQLANYLNAFRFPPLLNATKSQNTAQNFTWSPSWLPKGFKKIVEKTQVEDENGNKIESQMYSDGLFSFNIYVSEKLALANENVWKRGSYTIYTETVGDKEITLVGQIPITTAKRIIQDIVFKK